MRLVRANWPSLLISALLVSAVFGQRVFLPLNIGEKQPANFEILPALLRQWRDPGYYVERPLPQQRGAPAIAGDRP